MTLDPGDLDRVVRAALEEDLRYGPDVTTAAVIPPGTKSVADVVARQPGTLAGLPVVAAVLDVACPAATFTPQARDGERVATGDVVARVDRDGDPPLRGADLPCAGAVVSPRIRHVGDDRAGSPRAGHARRCRRQQLRRRILSLAIRAWI